MTQATKLPRLATKITPLQDVPVSEHLAPQVPAANTHSGVVCFGSASIAQLRKGPRGMAFNHVTRRSEFIKSCMRFEEVKSNVRGYMITGRQKGTDDRVKSRTQQYNCVKDRFVNEHQPATNIFNQDMPVPMTNCSNPFTTGLLICALVLGI